MMRSTLKLGFVITIFSIFLVFLFVNQSQAQTKNQDDRSRSDLLITTTPLPTLTNTPTTTSTPTATNTPTATPVNQYIALNANCTNAGTTIIIIGYQWPTTGNRNLVIYWEVEYGLEIGRINSLQSPTFSLEVTIPVTANGTHTIVAQRYNDLATTEIEVPCPPTATPTSTPTSTATPTPTFPVTVTPDHTTPTVIPTPTPANQFITLSPPCGSPNTVVTVSGFQWPTNGNFDLIVYWNTGNGLEIGRINSLQSPTFSLDVTIPITASNQTYHIVASRHNISATAEVSLPCPPTPTNTPSPTNTPTGTPTITPSPTPTATPVATDRVSIVAVNGDVFLGWEWNPIFCTYEVHRDSMPYFVVNAGTLHTTITNGNAIWSDPSGLDHFYKLRAITCADPNIDYFLNDTGAIHFEVIPGQ